MGTFHTSSFRASIKESGPGHWYILLELYDGTGIPKVDSGERQVALSFPDGASEEQVKALRDALHDSGAELALIE